MYPSNAQFKEEMEDKEREPKGACVFHVARVKHLPEHTTEQIDTEAITKA